ncbi:MULTISPECIES: GNAT family N-acetyltransferase [Rhodopirellula]|uniref:GNAT family N-acetyltransferase n=1 Tax=Rhodopirellula sp. MGV TaxID=2023130 RepID=UPI000B971699|nr:hypothetical protein CGZ80_21385 [Rhodopirellula sp. MGV]PNY36031.1 GNAT family N-acetyltransferase [Rhodopirellula baltica]
MEPRSLHASLTPFDKVTATELDHWRALRETDSNYQSPFFAVEFAQAVHHSRLDVDVAIVRRRHDPIAFLPLHRKGKHAYPVGRFLNDAHQLIKAPDENLGLTWLVTKLGLTAFHFHALIGEPLDRLPAWTCQQQVRSFRCDIGDQPDEYLASLCSRHNTVRRQSQKTRKLAREVGPVTFEFDCRCHDNLRQAINLKREQYQRTHTLDLFATPWTVKLIESLFHRPTDSRGPRGILSTLFAGDQMVAAHFGLWEADRLHYWFPAYDPAFSKYSPGTALFVSILQQAGQHRVRCIDMGYGEQPYKRKQTDSTGVVSQGCVSPSLAYRVLNCGRNRAIQASKSLPMRQPLKRIGRTIWPSAGHSKLQ